MIQFLVGELVRLRRSPGIYGVVEEVEGDMVLVGIKGGYRHWHHADNVERREACGCPCHKGTYRHTPPYGCRCEPRDQVPEEPS